MSGVAPDPLDRRQWDALGNRLDVILTPEEYDALVEVVRAARPIAEWLKQIGIGMDISDILADVQAFMVAEAEVARLDKDTA